MMKRKQIVFKKEIISKAVDKLIDNGHRCGRNGRILLSLDYPKTLRKLNDIDCFILLRV
jgi:hypothetical protein